MKTKVTITSLIIAKILISKYYAKGVQYNDYGCHCNQYEDRTDFAIHHYKNRKNLIKIY
jgi:hypothetical protein